VGQIRSSLRPAASITIDATTRTKGFDTDLAFMAAEINGDEMHFNVISRLGQTVDSGVLTRRRMAP